MQADAQGAAGPVEGSSEQGAPTAPQKRAETRRARSTHQLGEQQQHQLGTLARWRLKLSGLLPRLPRLTVLGRSTALLAFELALNVLVWTIALALWAPSDERRPVLSLGLIAWTLGLRHGLGTPFLHLSTALLVLILAAVAGTLVYLLASPYRPHKSADPGVWQIWTTSSR